MSTCEWLDLQTLGISTDYAQKSPRSLVPYHLVNPCINSKPVSALDLVSTVSRQEKGHLSKLIFAHSHFGL